jgi:5-methylcytosine-specific restriction endonuclease McrA
MRQGKAQASGCWIRKEKRLAIYIRDGFTCAYCGLNLNESAPQDVTLDHLTPRSQGGSNDATNLVTACRCCNSARGARSYKEFSNIHAVSRIETLRYAPLNIALARNLLEGE